MKTFVTERPLPGKDAGTFTTGSAASDKGTVTIDDAAFMVAEFENGALGVFEESRFASGRKNYYYFEIYGSKGSLMFDLERMNELQFLNLADPVEEQGFRTILVTNSTHPNGKRLVDDLVSHHYIITTGHNLNELEMVSKVFDLECVTL